MFFVKNNDMTLPEIMGNKFLYFGYGSNLLQKRIHIENKSAVRRNIGKLKDYQLDFYTNSTRWQGAPATVVENPGKVVWGAIWEIDVSNMADLDRQEGVSSGIYIPQSMAIETASGKNLTCRIYTLTKIPTILKPEDDIPFNRKPSSTYLKTIIKGAIESQLPADYIEDLKKIVHNGNTVEDIEKELDL